MRVLGLVELLLVEVRGVIPSEVLVARAKRHLHEALPVRLVGVDRLTEGPLKLVRGRALEGPPGTVVLAVEVTHGIPEASHGVHHRHRSVVHGVELIEAARLKPGGHEEDVAARGDAVRHLVAEPQPRPDLVPVPALHVVETVLEVLPAAAEEDELDVLVHEELLGVEHEVDALLLIETTDETNHDRVVALGESELPLERRLARLLARPETLEVKAVGLETVRLQEAIVRGVPVVEVDTVDDTAHLGGVVAHGGGEAPAALIGSQLPGVAGADGDDLGGVVDRRLHDVHAGALLGVVEVERAGVLVGETEAPDLLGVGPTLVGDVVDDVHRAREAELEVVLVERLEVHREEAGVPIVGYVNQVLVAKGEPAAVDVPDRLDARLGHQRAPPRHVHGAAGVNLVADLVEAGVIDEDDVDAVPAEVVIFHLNLSSHHVELLAGARGVALVVVVVHGDDGHDAVATTHERL